MVGSCRFYLVHSDSKKILDATFFIAINDGSMLLSCKTILVLGLIQPRTRLDYLPPRASLITSSVDHAKKAKSVRLSVCRSKQEVTTQSPKQEVATHTPVTTIAKKQDVPKLITYYPDVSEGIGKFPGPPYNVQLDPSIPPKQTPCCSVHVYLKESFKQEIDKILKAGILKPVHEATPWINSFVLVKGKDTSGNLKLCICLNPSNPNKVIIREPYHFKTPEDIANLIA